MNARRVSPVFLQMALIVAFATCLRAGLSGRDRPDAGARSREPDAAEPEAEVDYIECIVAPPESSRVPKPLRQGQFLSPQSVSALAISPDGRELAHHLLGNARRKREYPPSD